MLLESLGFPIFKSKAPRSRDKGDGVIFKDEGIKKSSGGYFLRDSAPHLFKRNIKSVSAFSHLVVRLWSSHVALGHKTDNLQKAK